MASNLSYWYTCSDWHLRKGCNPSYSPQMQQTKDVPMSVRLWNQNKQVAQRFPSCPSGTSDLLSTFWNHGKTTPSPPYQGLRCLIPHSLGWRFFFYKIQTLSHSCKKHLRLYIRKEPTDVIKHFYIVITESFICPSRNQKPKLQHMKTDWCIQIFSVQQ